MAACADEPDNRDFDVVRDEAKVPRYQLPPPLVSAEGKPVTTPEQWFNVGRRGLGRVPRDGLPRFRHTASPALSNL